MAERRVASQKCLTGQPVDIPGGSVLRTVLGAAQLKDLVSGKQPLDQMIEDDRVLLSKLALIARQYDYLLSHFRSKPSRTENGHHVKCTKNGHGSSTVSEKCQYACARGLVALSDETNGLENLPEYYLPDDIIITTALFAWSRTE